ncbi:MAG: GNAT family N-acetyltransferase [Gammaproteobacteria bacterium]|nr:GNAT family N-acetyltransferase [Gammaproteobacteria bacterium]
MPSETRADTTIVDWHPRYGDAFGQLNREWLEKYFRVEAVDEPVLNDPDRHVLSPGGVILYAVQEGRAVGTVALKYQGGGVYELTKMAVTRACQGQGVGRQLLRAAVARFGEIAGNRLYLESNSRLGPALSLYESAGFVHETPPEPSDYQRADVYMVYRESRASGAK